MKVNKVYTQGSVVKSLVFGLCILMGLQSALFVPTQAINEQVVANLKPRVNSSTKNCNQANNFCI